MKVEPKDLEPRELNSMEKLFEAFKGVGISCMEFSENLDRATKIMKEDSEQLTIKINDDLSELKPMGIKVTDQDGKVVIGEKKKEDDLLEKGKIDCLWNTTYQTAKLDDWKILDVNCLPEDILVKGKYDIEVRSISNHEWINNTFNEEHTYCIFEQMIRFNNEYRYRIKSTKKSHEELAEEYADETEQIRKDLRSDRNKLSLFEERLLLIKGFIAGRKSMESE